MSRNTSRGKQPPSASVSIGLVSLGCAKNLVDSQVMLDSLLADGITLAPTPEEADVVLVNTCSFIEDARKESAEAIHSACRHKNAGQCKAVIVSGCIPQRYKEKTLQMFPSVDAFIGLDQLRDIGDVVKRVLAGENGILEVSPQAAGLFEPRIPGVVLSRGPYAYLKIAEGCDHHCTFCAIPAIRGTHRSRHMDSIVREAESLLERGFRELNIISQDTMAYGNDLKDGSNLAGLIRSLGTLGGDFWIRLLYGYPSEVSEELLEAMASVRQVVPYLDIPVQHSHPDILRAMGRAGTGRDVMDMAARIRKALPDAALRTTCLVGFPGETEAHFAHLCDYARKTEFDHLGVFVFSPEENTPGGGMKNRPSPETAKERRGTLLEIQKAIVNRKARSLIGIETEVLLEKVGREGKNVWSGRSRREAPEIDGVVIVKKVPAGRNAGTFVRVRYTAPAGYDMKAVAMGK